MQIPPVTHGETPKRNPPKLKKLKNEDDDSNKQTDEETFSSVLEDCGKKIDISV